VDVLNLSLTGPRDPLLERLLAAAISAGVVVVAAQPDGARTTAFPAGVDGVIAVLAAESESAVQRSDGSLFAPGREILTLAPEDRYDYVSGSSVAAAHVSGIAALIREIRPQMRHETVRELLVRTSAEVPSSAGVSRFVVNACAAVADLVGRRDCSRAVAAAATAGSGASIER
jgi:subtilisin family serine protease